MRKIEIINHLDDFRPSSQDRIFLWNFDRRNGDTCDHEGQTGGSACGNYKQPVTQSK